MLINIFGGILRVDTLAKGVVEAATKTKIQLPIVLRLEGTNVEQGREILKESGFNFIVAETMKDAAEKVVAAVKPARLRLRLSGVLFRPAYFSRFARENTSLRTTGIIEMTRFKD